MLCPRFRWRSHGRKSQGALVVSAVLLWLAGCRTSLSAPPSQATGTATPAVAGSSPVRSTETFPQTLTVAPGKTLVLNRSPQRILSLAPSNTEILYALGEGDHIVADTTSCDWPEAAKSKPHITVFPLDVEAIQILKPDLVVALGSINQKMVVPLERAKIPVLTVSPKTVAETYDAIRLLGKATGQTARAEEIVTRMQAQIEAVKRAVAKAPTRPKVLIMYDDRKIYTTSPPSVIDDLINVAGGRNIANPQTAKDNIISAEQVIVSQPDVILCAPGLVERARRIPGWSEAVPAVRQNRFFVPSQEAPLERPGPRLAAAAEALARYLHPEQFPSKSAAEPPKDGG